MANEEQIEILQQGVKVWNQWREEHPDRKIDLTGAHLRGTDLDGADLGGADLEGVDRVMMGRQDFSVERFCFSVFEGFIGEIYLH